MRYKTANIESCKVEPKTGSGHQDGYYCLILDGQRKYTMYFTTAKQMYVTVRETLNKSSAYDEELGFCMPGNFIGYILLPSEELVSLYKTMKGFFGEIKQERKEDRKKPGRKPGSKPKVKQDE